ncbi:hypothetical protein [Vibrio parahaemolyticus]|uniref:hypothetical protein n=1 Tax=Vibrio parahaemolyticus TaxID=670 RepID=UPI00226B1A19|nr:hypothetical protein [Vibrio parahaemolyticus]MCX8941242.1 hypothetical protein [Vibrio parahaemolyticus]
MKELENIDIKEELYNVVHNMNEIEINDEANKAASAIVKFLVEGNNIETEKSDIIEFAIALTINNHFVPKQD